MTLVLTIWEDKTYKIWSWGDAYYAQNDEDFMLNIPLEEVKIWGL